MWGVKRLANKGDTIIEVLIALSVLAFILTLSYTMTSRSLQVIQQAHERSQALKIAEGQVEQLKTLANRQAVAPLLTGITYFCFEDLAIYGFGAPAPPYGYPNSTNLDTDKFGYVTTPANKCTNLGPGGHFNASIEVPAVVRDNPFIIRVRWERYGGGGNDEVKLEYRALK